MNFRLNNLYQRNMNLDLTNILTIVFEQEIATKEIPLLRGAIIHALDNKLLLFHNHEENNKYRYSYPLIQYKRIHKKASIVCINQGTEDVGELFSSRLSHLQLGENGMDIKIEKIIPQRYRIQIWEQMFNYYISKWLPLNSRNYKKYLEIEGLSDKVHFLEHILKGNILSFAKGIGIRFDKDIELVITDISDPFVVLVKGTKMHCINAHFKCNVSLPNYIGLGKHVSVNYGVVTKKEHIK